MKVLAFSYGPVLIGFVFIEHLSKCLGITTIHHNKPYEATIPVMAASMKEHQREQQYVNVTLPASERHKRLLPYMNFYVRQNFNRPYQQIAPPQQQQQIPHNSNAQRYRLLVPKHNRLQPLLRKLNQLTNGNFQPPPIREQRGKINYTPFTETNALPGPFIPMKINQGYPNAEQPNFSEIYDKLLQLKYAQQQQHQQIQYDQQYQKRPTANYIPIKNYEEPPLQNLVQPAKTTIQTYTPTHVDVHPQSFQYEQSYYRQNVPRSKPVYQLQRPVQIIEMVDPQIQKQQQLVQELIDKPVVIIREKQPIRQPSLQSVRQQSDEEKERIFEEQLRIYEDQQNVYRNEQQLLEEEQRQIAEEERRKYVQQIQKPLVFGQKILPQQANLQNHQFVIAQDYSQEQKYELPDEIQPPQKIQAVQPSYAPYNQKSSNIEANEELSIPTEQLYQHQYPVTESPDNLGEILRKLQASNTLPQNLTPENIDNSIKTLVRILNILKKHQRLSKTPIIVLDQDEDAVNEAGGKYEQPGVDDISNVVVQNFPADTAEGGTPGKPGIDYPALYNIPQTSFNCKTQRYKGFFGDPDTHCQVWHYCDFNGGQASFLCPNGTIFSQVALTCDWWYNVKCSSTPQLYVLNERLYKYILPFSPKFPEDYTGPLVDRYLALKFQEMEEKMKKHRKKPKESSDQDQRKDEDKDEADKESQDEDTKDDDDDADQLQKHNEENRKHAGGTSEEIHEENNVRRSVS